MSDYTLSWTAKRFLDKQKMKCFVTKRNIKYYCKNMNVNFYSPTNIIKFNVGNKEVEIWKYEWIQWQLWPCTTVVLSSHCGGTAIKRQKIYQPSLTVHAGAL